MKKNRRIFKTLSSALRGCPPGFVVLEYIGTTKMDFRFSAVSKDLFFKNYQNSDFYKLHFISLDL